MTKKYEPAKEENRDLPAKVIRVAAGAVPFLGPTLMELIAEPLQERRAQWEDEIAYGLNKLEAEHSGFKRDQLKTNEEFATAILQATQMAQRTHDPAKRAALRNAVLNVACGQTPGDDLQQMFLQWIDIFTAGHLRILALFRNPAALVDMGGMMTGGLTHVIERAFPDLRGREPLYDQMFKDLRARGLVNTDSLHTTMSGHGLMAKRTTDLGDAFLDLIASPID